MVLIAFALSLSAQTVTNVRTKLDLQAEKYVISYDLSGSPKDSYAIRLMPTRQGKKAEPVLNALGDGISRTCKPGRNRKLEWYPLKSGLELSGWQFRLSAVKQPSGMAFVQGGTFLRGRAGSEREPLHKVFVSSFFISIHEVTQQEWLSTMGSIPAQDYSGTNLPVTFISWFDAVDYCAKLSRKHGLNPCYSGKGDQIKCDWTATGYRLPTEAEWEFAARGGRKSKGYSFAGSNNDTAVGWIDTNSGLKPHPVGTKRPNELGLYDFTGNVWEWCWDWFDPYYYKTSPIADPRGAQTGRDRAIRGGAINGGASTSGRYSFPPGSKYEASGFRIVLPIY